MHARLAVTCHKRARRVHVCLAVTCHKIARLVHVCLAVTCHKRARRMHVCLAVTCHKTAGRVHVCLAVTCYRRVRLIYTDQTGQDGHEQRGDGAVAGHLCDGRCDVAQDECHAPPVQVCEHLQ